MASKPRADRFREKRRFRRALHRPPPGSSPSHLSAPHGAEATRVRLTRYGPESIEERPLASIADLAGLDLSGTHVLWLQVAGLANLAFIQAIATHFGLHRLMVEDAVTAIQRPKSESFGDSLFVVLKMPPPAPGEAADQVSLVLRPGLVITIDERAGDCFDPVRARLKRPGAMRSAGADYLAYALIDAVIDSYFPLLEAEGEQLDLLDAEVTDPRAASPLAALHAIRQRLMGYRRAIWPLRDVLSALQREAGALVTPFTQPYLRDAHDHVIELIDLLELHRETAIGLAELHVAMVSVRMNDVMKLLTLISTIFMPLTFVAGVYGMNFDPDVSGWNMPELRWTYGYPFALGLMLAMGLGLYLLFRRLGLIKWSREA